MSRSGILVAAFLTSLLVAPFVRAADKADTPQKLPPFLQELLKGSADDFIKRFDRNRDGYLTKDELPPRLAQNFDKLDRNGDGKLDKNEVEMMMQGLRKRFGIEKEKAQSAANRPAAGGPEVDRLVNRWLEQMDTNKDGKLSKDEAKAGLAQNFEQIDSNKDGYLDRAELRRAAGRFLARQGGGPGRPGPGAGPLRPTGPDFDALDLNADGRLTRAELKGTPYADHFDEIDTNKDGKIDRKEFEAYLKKRATAAK